MDDLNTLRAKVEAAGVPTPIQSPGIKRVLLERLDDALAAYRAGNRAAAINALEKFIDQVDKHVDEPFRAEWIREAEAIVTRIRRGD